MPSKHKTQNRERQMKKGKKMKDCQELMTKEPACCLATDKVYAIAQLMHNQDIGAIPVVDNHKDKTLIGIITDRDLAVRVVGASRDATNTLVSDVMTKTLHICHPDDAIDTALDTMVKHQLRRIPVVDANNQVVGIISQADIAIRLRNHDKVGQLVGEISQPDGVSIN